MKSESAQQIQTITDDTVKHLRDLTALGQPTDQWNALLIFILANKLDETTVRAWEREKSNLENQPKLKDS